MSDAVAIRIGPLPKLFGRYICDQFIHFVLKLFVILNERGGQGRRKIRHGHSPFVVGTLPAGIPASAFSLTRRWAFLCRPSLRPRHCAARHKAILPLTDPTQVALIPRLESNSGFIST